MVLPNQMHAQGGIVHDGMQAVEMAAHPIHQCDAGVRVRYVRRYCQGIVAQFFRQGFQCGTIDVGDADFPAGTNEFPRQRLTDAAGRAGDDGDALVCIHGVSSLFSDCPVLFQG